MSMTLPSFCASFHRWSGIEIPASYSFVQFLRQQSLKLWRVLYMRFTNAKQDIFLFLCSESYVIGMDAKP